MHLKIFLNRVYLPLAVTLCLGIMGCSKKEEPAPVANIGSYAFITRKASSQDTRQVSCQARAVLSSDSSFDYLDITLTTTPQPASGTEFIKLSFYKHSGQPANAYEFYESTITNSEFNGHPFINKVATLVSTSDGGFSGTFSGNFSTLVGFIYQTDYSLSSGVFTNVH
jgi:hypothetical protein